MAKEKNPTTTTEAANEDAVEIKDASGTSKGIEKYNDEDLPLEALCGKKKEEEEH